MSKRRKIERRQFLRRVGEGSLAAAAGYGLLPGLSRHASAAPASHRVVRVHSESATSWSGPWPVPQSGPPYYFDSIDAGVAKSMFDQGIQLLTGTSSPSAAWQQIIEDYTAGDKVVIKVNLNCCSGPEDTDNRMDATAPLIDAVLDGLIDDRGIPTEDILVYDTSRYIPTVRLLNRSRYPASVFSTNHGVWDETEPEVTFDDAPPSPGATGEQQVCTYCHYYVSADLTAARYLINMPLLKAHPSSASSGAGFTGALKNHYGSVAYPSKLHDEDKIYGGVENCSYIPDVNNNPHIRDKTRLIVADGLFGHYSTNGDPPVQWLTFGGGTPNSVLVSFDPVAIDSVMLDMIRDEMVARGRQPQDPHYLQIAANYGLGVHERKPYSEIEYIENELGVGVTRTNVDNVIRQFKSNAATESDVITTIDQYMSGE